MPCFEKLTWSWGARLEEKVGKNPSTLGPTQALPADEVGALSVSGGSFPLPPGSLQCAVFLLSFL